MVRGLPPLEVKLWGDYACFTRPEMKVERVTYPVRRLRSKGPQGSKLTSASQANMPASKPRSRGQAGVNDRVVSAELGHWRGPGAGLPYRSLLDVAVRGVVSAHQEGCH